MTEPVIAVAQLYGAAGRSEELRELLREHRARGAQEPGCTMFRVSVALDDPECYLMTQEWESADAVRGYMRSPALYDFQRRIIDLLTREWRMRFYFVGDALNYEDVAPMDPRRAD